GETDVISHEILRSHRDLALSFAARVKLYQEPSRSPDFRTEHVVLAYKFARDVSLLLGDLPAVGEFKTKAHEVSQLLWRKADLTRVKYPFIQADFFLLVIVSGSAPKSLGFGYRHSSKGSHPWERGRSEGWHHLSSEALCMALGLADEELRLQEFGNLLEIFKQWVENLTQQGIHAIYTLTQLGPEWCKEGADILFNLALISPEYIDQYLVELIPISVQERVGISWTRALYPALNCIDVLVRNPDPNIPPLRNTLQRLWILNPPAQLFEVEATYFHYTDSQAFENYVNAFRLSGIKSDAARADKRSKIDDAT
ncbi:MAG TPA: hypothetical protein VKK79_22620, partial [Candidatus Lokiarchaeia archaeon]|nr:hypothetical protein [Candidatus Lokiarchaeia archaeon]